MAARPEPPHRAASRLHSSRPEPISPIGRGVVWEKAMVNQAILAAGVALAVAAGPMVWDSPLAQNNLPAATVSNPAVLTAAAAPDQGIANQSPRAIISVTGFRPPRDGGVEAVVKVQKEDGQSEQEIGRFGIFPNTEFTAADPSNARRFGLPLPKELAGSKALKLHVYLVPFRGSGEGAVLELGGAEIR
jgi:hypothetical protein